MRDNSICFWSSDDNFKFERRIQSNLPNFQIKIWHLETVNNWITTDKTNVLHVWSPEIEEC